MSKINWTIMACLCMALTTVELTQSRGWRGVVPLHSTRADVERLLGSPKESRGVASTYESKDQRVIVFYSAGRCKETGSDAWNVPRDTVLSITIHPNAKLLVHDLNLDKTKYERVANDHIQGVIYYFNKEEGVRISARLLEKEGEDVDSITYEPAARDNNLRCSRSAPQQSAPNSTEYLILKFDEYSGLPLEDERARLDNFAIHLQKDQPQFKGYIIVYARANARSQAKAHAKWAKDYLVNVRNIVSSRISAMDGGCRRRMEVELYALPNSLSPPKPNASCD